MIDSKWILGFTVIIAIGGLIAAVIALHHKKTDDDVRRIARTYTFSYGIKNATTSLNLNSTEQEIQWNNVNVNGKPVSFDQISIDNDSNVVNEEFSIIPYPGKPASDKSYMSFISFNRTETYKLSTVLNFTATENTLNIASDNKVGTFEVYKANPDGSNREVLLKADIKQNFCFNNGTCPCGTLVNDIPGNITLGPNSNGEQARIFCRISGLTGTGTANITQFNLSINGQIV